LQVSASSAFGESVLSQSGLTGVSQVITGLSASTEYYWRVSATNSFGTSGWSNVWSFTTAAAGSVAIDWISIPAGNFTMGSTASDPNYQADELPQHTVYLDAYQISKYEITNSQYKAFMDAGGYSNSAYWTTDGWTWRTTNSITEPYCWTSGEYNSGPAFPNHPVVGVSWYEAYAFCNWAGGTLPTEAQWEKAARGTDARYYPWGSTWDASKCNSYYSTAPDTFAYSSPVGFFTAGASYYGVYDMAGNVWEWCNDWYGSAYYSDPGANNNPPGPATGSYRVVRGGSFGVSERFCRSANRNNNNGFRPAILKVMAGVCCRQAQQSAPFKTNL
jgi:formylglycine-generating enzyme required for sulfatase activity